MLGSWRVVRSEPAERDALEAELCGGRLRIRASDDPISKNLFYLGGPITIPDNAIKNTSRLLQSTMRKRSTPPTGFQACSRHCLVQDRAVDELSYQLLMINANTTAQGGINENYTRFLMHCASHDLSILMIITIPDNDSTPPTHPLPNTQPMPYP